MLSNKHYAKKIYNMHQYIIFCVLAKTLTNEKTNKTYYKIIILLKDKGNLNRPFMVYLPFT